MNVLFQAYVTR